MFKLNYRKYKLILLLRLLLILHFLSVIAFTYLGIRSEQNSISLLININIYDFFYLCFYLLSLVLLFILNSYGKIFFTLLVIEGVVASFSSPERIITLPDLFIFLTYFEGILDGAILVIIYLTPLKKLFKSVKGFL